MDGLREGFYAAATRRVAEDGLWSMAQKQVTVRLFMDLSECVKHLTTVDLIAATNNNF